jgi:DinB superfamily
MKNPYAAYLGDRDPLVVLAATPGTLYALFSPLLSSTAGKEFVNRQPAPGKWSPREILAHLADCEIASAYRIRQALAEPNHIMQPFDQDLWAANYAEYDAASALATFVTLRNWNMLLLKTLQPQDWQRTVSHPERGTGILRELIETMAGHDLNHLERLAPMVQAAGSATA